MTAPAEPTLREVLEAIVALEVDSRLTLPEDLRPYTGVYDFVIPTQQPGWPFRLRYQGWTDGFEVRLDVGPEIVWRKRYSWGRDRDHLARP